MIAIRRAVTVIGAWREDSSWAVRSGDRWADRWRLVLDFSTSRFLRWRMPAAGGITRRATLGGGLEVSYRWNRADVYTMREVWVEQEYRLPGLRTPHVVVDIGANVGLTSAWLIAGGADVVLAVEPSAANHALAVANIASAPRFGRAVLGAAGEVDGTAGFLEGMGATNGRLSTAGDDQAGESVRMYAMTTLLAMLPDDVRVDLLKVDIEGGEERLLSGDVSWLGRVDQVILEIHPQLADEAKVRGVLENAGLVLRSERRVHENVLVLYHRPVMADAVEEVGVCGG